MDVLSIQFNPFGRRMQRLKAKQQTELESVLKSGERSWKSWMGQEYHKKIYLQTQPTSAHGAHKSWTADQQHTWLDLCPCTDVPDKQIIPQVGPLTFTAETGSDSVACLWVHLTQPYCFTWSQWDRMPLVQMY